MKRYIQLSHVHQKVGSGRLTLISSYKKKIKKKIDRLSLDLQHMYARTCRGCPAAACVRKEVTFRAGSELRTLEKLCVH